MAKSKSKTTATSKSEAKGYGSLSIIGQSPMDLAARAGVYQKYSDASQMLARVYGITANCADIQASFISSQTKRLYRRVGAPTKGYAKTRKVNKDRKAYLLNKDKVGGKTALWADQSDEIEEVTQAPILDLLHDPNETFGGAELAYLLAWQRAAVGNSYVVARRKGDAVTSLDVLYPQFVKLVPDRNGGLWGYSYGNEQDIPRQEVFHQRYRPSRYHPIFGESPLHGILIAADVINAQTIRELAFQENNARPDYAVVVPPETTDKQLEETETYWRSRLGGPRNEGKFAVLRDSTITPLGFSPKDLQGPNLRKVMAQDILAAYGIPESEYFLNEANLASSTTGNLNFYRRIRPLLIRNAEEWTRWLIPLFYPDAEMGDYYFAYDEILPAESAPRLSPDQELLLGVKTINEWRQENGYEPIEGGDEPRINGVAMAQAAITAAAPPEVEPENETPDETPAEKEAPAEKSADDCDCTLPEKRSAGADRSSDCALPSAQERVAEQARIRKARIHADVKTELPYAEAEVRALQKAIDKVYQETADSMSVDAQGQVDLGDFKTRLEMALKEKIPATFQRGGQDGLVKLSQLPGGQARLTELNVSFDVVPERSLAFLDKHIVQSVQIITDNLRTDVTEALKTGLEDGQSVQDISKAIQQTLGGERWKSERIARTETANAYVSGQSSAWAEAGISKVKTLLAPNPCPTCIEKAAAQGDGIPIDSARTLRVPFHPNCRCDEVPIITE